MNLEEVNVEAARKFIDLYNEGKSDYADHSHSKDAQWVELPFLGPKGRSGDLEFLKEMAVSACEKFPDRKMLIRKIVGQSDTVVLECEWTGTLSKNFEIENKSLKVGDVLKFDIVIFLKFRDQKIIQQVDYCTLTIQKASVMRLT